jgi:hypothetical protein
MMNIGSRAPTCPPFIMTLRERGFTAIHDRHPDQDADRIGFPIRRSGDHFPNRCFILCVGHQLRYAYTYHLP